MVSVVLNLCLEPVVNRVDEFLVSRLVPNLTTEVHVSTTTDLSGVMKMAGPLLTRRLRKQMRVDHENLKHYLESGKATE